jgi:hypothetical protein
MITLNETASTHSAYNANSTIRLLPSWQVPFDDDTSCWIKWNNMYIEEDYGIAIKVQYMLVEGTERDIDACS